MYRMKIVFIAGPYMGDGSYEIIERNIREAEKYQVALANHHVGFFCSHGHTGHFDNREDIAVPGDFYFNLGMRFLERAADAVLAMPGWEKSGGAKYEVEWALKNNIQVFYPKDIFDIEEIVKWAKDDA